MVLVDAVVRLIPGVISEPSLDEESFSNGLLEYPQFTRPQEYEGMAVPEVLLSGNHEKIKRWRYEESKKRTLNNRPELFIKTRITMDEDEDEFTEE
jgi:tRNA (guanine37-N1)-methyltransferase